MAPLIVAAIIMSGAHGECRNPDASIDYYFAATYYNLASLQYTLADATLITVGAWSNAKDDADSLQAGYAGIQKGNTAMAAGNAAVLRARQYCHHLRARK